MKLNELIEIEKVLRELVYFKPGANNSSEFFKMQNNASIPLGWLLYEIQKHSKQIKVEIENE
jgi:hypothetical protein